MRGKHVNSFIAATEDSIKLAGVNPGDSSPCLRPFLPPPPSDLFLLIDILLSPHAGLLSKWDNFLAPGSGVM